MAAAHARRRSLVLWGRARWYDAVCALTRVVLGGVFTHHALGLRGRESELGEHMSGSVLAPLGLLSPALPALLVAVSIAFGVGLLTWVTGPLLAATVLLGHLAPASAEFAPLSGWGTSALVFMVCLFVVAAPGRWSWDHLVPASSPRGRARAGDQRSGGSRTKARTVFRRRPEHAPPLLYPEGQAEFRRPSEL